MLRCAIRNYSEMYSHNPGHSGGRQNEIPPILPTMTTMPSPTGSQTHDKRRNGRPVPPVSFTPKEMAVDVLGDSGEVDFMLYYALVFFVIALIAGILGFGGVAFAAAGIAKILFFLFIIAFLVSLIMHAGRRV